MTPAGAATATTPNSCLWNFDNETRDQALTLTGEATPDPTTVGQNVTLAGTTLTSEIDGEVGKVAADLGIFQVGPNAISGTTWVAIEGTNSTQGTQVVSGTFTANVVVTGAPGSYAAAATPISIALPNTTWTPVAGGTVDFKQAAAGGIPGTIPAGPGGAQVDPQGAAFIKVGFGAINITLDCAAGDQADPWPTAGLRPTFESITVGTGPVTPPSGVVPDHECISGLGRYKGAEIQGLELGLSRSPVALAATPASTSVSLNNAKLNVGVPSDIILMGYRDSHNLFANGTNTFRLQAWAAVAASNTVEGVQTLAVEANYNAVVTDPTPANKDSGDETAADIEIVLNLPTSTWTSTGTGPIEFTEATAGSLSPIGVIGTGYQETPYKVYPYGSIFVRAETANYGANLDCVRGDVTVNPAPVPGFSNFGDLPPAPAGSPAVVPSNPDRGSRGRYTVVDGAPIAPFATGSVSTNPDNAGQKGEIVTVKVVGSPLQLSVAGRLVTLSTVKLNGTDQTSTGPLKQVTVVDPRGTNSGWNLVGVASVFNGTNANIASANLGWTPASTTATPGPAVASGLNTAQTLCSAAVGTAGGTFTCDAGLSLLVPSTTPIGTYTSTLSLTLI